MSGRPGPEPSRDEGAPLPVRPRNPAGRGDDTPVPDGTAEPPGPPVPTDPETALCEALLHELPGSVPAPLTPGLLLAGGGASVRCAVVDVQRVGDLYVAELSLRVAGPRLGPDPVPLAAGGYRTTPARAAAEGGRSWARVFGPVLFGSPGAAGPRRVEAVGGRRFRVEGVAAETRLTPRGPAAGAVTGTGPLRELPRLLREGALPLLTGDDPVLVTVSCGPVGSGRELRVHLGGVPWTAAAETAPEGRTEAPEALGVAATAGGHGAPAERTGPLPVLHRELALLHPLDPPAPLHREPLARTLAGFDQIAAAPGETAGWPGWWAHGGRLHPPLAPASLQRAERGTGPLPEGYRRFLLEVAGGGAGPGYGLLPPRLHAGPDGDPVVPLAQAGCGVAWVLRAGRRHHGEVWLDATAAWDGYRRVSAGVPQWYGAWLDWAVRERGPWTQWDRMRCTAASMVTDLVEREARTEPTGSDGPGPVIDLSGRVGTGGIRLASGGGYLPAGTPLDPCHGCVELVAGFGLGADAFAPGMLAGGPGAAGRRPMPPRPRR